jgi:hypothetical protein
MAKVDGGGWKVDGKALPSTFTSIVLTQFVMA